MEVSSILNRHLRPYQRAGVRFLFSRCFCAGVTSRGRICGAVLADDMGLGKTVQVIALVSALARRTHVRETDAAM